jgi:hypothetical protein
LYGNFKEMARETVTAVLIQQQQQQIALTQMTFYHKMAVDYFLPIMRQKRVDIPRVENYYEVTIPRYSPDDFKSHFRLTRETFQSTCQRLSQTEEFNKLKGPTPNVEKDLLMFLWYIGNLKSYRSMADRFGTSKGSFHLVAKRMSSALAGIMPEVIKWPNTQADFIETSREFSEKSQFQNVVGAIDGCHIQIKALHHQPNAYYNRKIYHSIVLLGCCNAKMEFNYVWTGNPGSTHDAPVLRSSDLFQNSNVKIPPGYYLLGDSAFPILEWLITPFRDCGNLTRQQKLFNKTHSQCRQVIERAFGMLKCRFRRLLRFDISDISLLVDSVLAACVLHNLCLYEDDIFDLPDEDIVCNDDLFAREGHQLQGIRIRQQLMNQLV